MLVHGELLRDLEEYKQEIYKETEDLLRNIVKKSILDQAFADIFALDERINEEFPIS